MSQRVSSRGLFAAAVAAGLLFPVLSQAQVTGSTTQTTDAQGRPQENVSLSVQTGKKKKDKSERVQQSKDTKKENKKEDKLNPLAAKDATLPDKQLYDKALDQEKKGHFDVARLDLQTLLNTYPDSQYQMRAKLAIADCWYREGGSAALAQAEQEYKDFITFFPNAPEAAEAQMRVGDIYFKQMDVPDRDYKNAINAETEYRTMLKQYPDAPPEILKQAKQKLRDVQEVLAARETNIAQFYASHENWPAAIARYQTVADTYPQYSHMDDTLIAIGDAYEAEAKAVRDRPTCAPGVVVPCLPEGAKSKLEQDFDSKAAAEYRKVVLEHAAAPHVQDAKERLVAMNLDVPTPTPEAVAASEALEGSRAQYTMKSRLELLFLRKPDTVSAAQAGEPPLDDPSATTAPSVVKELEKDFTLALNPNAKVESPAAPKTNAPTSDADAAPATPVPPPVTNATPALEDVPAAGAGSSAGAATEMTPSSPGTSAGSGASMGVEVLSTGGSNGGTKPPSDLPAATGKPDANYGLTTAAPKSNAELPAAEKPAEAPDQVNEAAGKPQPPAPATEPTTNKKKKAKTQEVYDKTDESSSQKKPKKGLDKLNPF